MVRVHLGVRELEWCWLYGVAGSNITRESGGVSVELAPFVPILNDTVNYLYFASRSSESGFLGVGVFGWKS